MDKRLLKWVGLTSPHHQQPIIVKTFVDLFLDMVGYYAVGHHDAHAFLAVVAKQEPNFRLSKTEVKWVWAKLDNQSFEEVDELTDGATPITRIEVYR